MSPPGGGNQWSGADRPVSNYFEYESLHIAGHTVALSGPPYKYVAVHFPYCWDAEECIWIVNSGHNNKVNMRGTDVHRPCKAFPAMMGQHFSGVTIGTALVTVRWLDASLNDYLFFKIKCFYFIQQNTEVIKDGHRTGSRSTVRRIMAAEAKTDPLP